jgi:type VI secretion system protein ImpH
MVAQDRTAARALGLGRALQSEPYRYDFFQAVRSLECVHPGKPRIGRSLRPVDDPVRLGQQPSLAFAASALASYEPAANGRPPRLSGYFFGLLGPNGPLPTHLTEYAYDRARNAHDPTFARFLDVFHHRMLTLFYRAWANARPTVSFDRPEADWFGVYLASLCGLGMDSLRDRDALPDLAKLHYAGRLACQSRHAEGLRAFVEDFFGLPARIEEFVGAWMDLPEDGRCRLGRAPETGTLGMTAIAGARVWGCQQKFRVVLGPLDFGHYRRLLPGGDSLRRLVALVRNYIGDELNWDLNLILKREEVPALLLGGSERLGWSTWLGRRTAESDAGDLMLDPSAHAA